MAASSPTKLLLFFPLLLLLHAGGALARGRHAVFFRAPDLRPSSLLWDPAAQHFLVGSRHRPAVTSVSDAGVLDPLVSDPDLPPGSSFPSLALDTSRRRLLAVVAGPSAHLAAYDLRSPRPHSRLFLSPLPSSPAGVAVDPATGAAYVTSATEGLIWRVDLQGEASVFSRSEAYGNGGGLAGIAHVGKGYLLAVQPPTGKVFKVDAEDGGARTVLIAGKKGVAGAEAIAIRFDDSAAVAGGGAAWIVTSNDGWGEAAVYDKVAVAGGGEGGRAAGVAVREGRKVYVLISGEGEGNLGKEGCRVEEVEWDRDQEGEWVVGLVLLGLGLAYFLYWRFQMGRLVTDMNKKRS